MGDFEKRWLRLYPKDVPDHIFYPEISVADLLTESALKNPKKNAIIYFDSKITYEELDQLSNRFANALVDLGVRKGDRLALFLPNIPVFIIGYYGAIRSGAIVTALSSMYKEREVEHQLIDSGAETIVVLDLFYPIVASIIEKTKLKRVIVARARDYMPKVKATLGTLLGKIPSYKIEPKPGVLFFQDLIRNNKKTQPPQMEINSVDDVAVLQYTGGTTGIAKGAMLTHKNIVSNTLMCSKWIGKQEGAFLSVLPLFHIYGLLTGLNAPIYMGLQVVLFPTFDIKQVLQAIQKYRVTLFCGVPTLYSRLLSHPDIEKYDFSSLRFCLSGSSTLTMEIRKEFMEKTGCKLFEGYGLSEASPITHCNPFNLSDEAVKVGSIGIPWPDTDARIVDQEMGENILKPGEIGELIVRGPQVMKGYWNMPSETAAVLRDGWLYTGDLVKMDEEGYFYFVDRKKDLIKCKGYSVYPRELEDVLYEHPAIKLCCVVGKPDKEAGEVPKAFVVLRKGASATADELLSFVNEKVAHYKGIRELEFRSDLPMTLIGKVSKRLLREMN